MNTSPPVNASPPMDQPLYVALLEAGVEEEKARAAAISVRAPNPEIIGGLIRNLRFTRRAYISAMVVFLIQCVILGLQVGQLAGKLWGAP